MLIWERWLASRRSGRRWEAAAGWSDIGAVGIFALLALGSIALGSYRAWDDHERTVVVVATLESIVLSVVIVAVGHGMLTARTSARRALASLTTGQGSDA